MREKTSDILFRRRILSVIIIGFVAVSLFKLFNMQILEGPVYDEKSEENSIKKKIQQAPRGIFYDRNMEVMVSNKPSFTVQIVPVDYDRGLDSLVEYALGVDSGYVDKILVANRRYSKYSPRVIKRNVDFNFIAWYEENAEDLPGVEYRVDLQRDYSYGINGSHMFGYNREVSAEFLAANKDKYDMGDIAGYAGLEKEYENYLRGKKGITFTLVDATQMAMGPYLEGSADIEPEKGNDLVLSIDKRAQIAAEKALEGKKGAIVAMEPSTGDILAFVSAPEYDLSQFASVTSSEAWQKLNRDEDNPLFNRATMSIYPPGSTFKMFEALVALDEGIISPSYSVNCPGGYQYGNRFFKCTHVHGRTGIVKSIEQSCNTFYYGLILKIGLERWHDYAKRFGFGKRTGLDIGQETPGILPNAEYYDRVYGKNKWTEGYIVSLGIGQGELSATPVQLAQYTSLLANYGKTYTPHIVKGYIDRKTGEYKEFEHEEVNTGISRQAYDIVRKGMYEVVQGEGTGRWIRMKDIEIAGKTGTAQNPHGEDHALFVAFAPYDNPKIAVAVIVENVGYGSTHAAPVARDVIKAYLQKPEKEENSQDEKNDILLTGR